MKNKENMYFETRSEPALQEGQPDLGDWC